MDWKTNHPIKKKKNTNGCRVYEFSRSCFDTERIQAFWRAVKFSLGPVKTANRLPLNGRSQSQLYRLCSFRDITGRGTLFNRPKFPGAPPPIIPHQRHPSTKERVIRQSNQNIHALKLKYLKREGLNKRRHGAGGETGKENEISEQHKNPKLKPKQKTKKHTATSQQSVQFSRSVVSDSLRPHEPQQARPPCPSPTL